MTKKDTNINTKTNIVNKPELQKNKRPKRILSGKRKNSTTNDDKDTSAVVTISKIKNNGNSGSSTPDDQTNDHDGNSTDNCSVTSELGENKMAQSRGTCPNSDVTTSTLSLDRSPNGSLDRSTQSHGQINIKSDIDGNNDSDKENTIMNAEQAESEFEFTFKSSDSKQLTKEEISERIAAAAMVGDLDTVEKLLKLSKVDI